MKITSLTPSKHIKERYLIELENGDIIKVDLNLIAGYDLYPGKDLDTDALIELRSASEKAMAKAKALRIMGARNMSRREITDRLVQKGEREEVAESTADWLEYVGAVNDEEYARMIVRHYSAKGYGVSRVKNELYRRGIPRELWEDAMEEMPDMEDKAYTVLCQKLRGGNPDRAMMKKATDALLRRGFSWEEVRTAMSKYQCEHDFESEEYYE